MKDKLDELEHQADEARAQVKDLWAGNVVFRAAVIGAGIAVLAVLVAAAL